MLERDDAGDASRPIHYLGQMHDLGANSYKIWVFYTSGPSYTLAYTYYELKDWNAVPLCKAYGWGPDASGNTYLQMVWTYLNPGQSSATQTLTIQTRNIYGNLTQSQVYDYGNTSTPARTYNFTYLHQSNSNYLTRYIRNRITQANVTTSAGTMTLSSSTYDFDGNCNFGGLSTRNNTPRHDDSYDANYFYRGNIVGSYPFSISTSGLVVGKRCWAYETTGVARLATGGSSAGVTISPSASTNFSLPGLLTPGSNSDLATSITYVSSFAVTSVTGPNGANGTTTYDNYGRPQKTKSPDGVETNYTYTYNPTVQTATIGTGATARWKKTTLGGFGRVVRVETGHDANSSTPTSTVDTEYAPCACSPLGKLYRVSQPYGPGQTPLCGPCTPTMRPAAP